MKPQRHVWVLEDKDNGVRNNDCLYRHIAIVYMDRGGARHERDAGQRVVKYVPENKALIQAAKETIYAIVRDSRAVNATLDAAEKLQKALGAE